MRPQSRAWGLFWAALSALVFFLIYQVTISSPFQFDDHSNVIFHRAIRYLDNPRVFLETMHQRVRPVTNVSLALNYALHGLRVEGYHWVNIGLHLSNGLLLGTLVGKGFPKFKPWNWAVALLFLFHPLSVDAVTYISGRSTLLVLFFLLVACLVFLAERLSAPLRFFLLLVFMALAVLSKESGAVAPLLLAALGLVKNGKIHRRGERIILGGFFCLVLVFIWTKRVYLMGAWSGYFRFQGDVQIHSFGEWIRYWLGMCGDSLLLFLRPDYLAIDHETVPLHSAFSGRALLLWLLLISLPFFVWRSLKHGRSMLFLSSAWFCLALAPTHSIFPVLDPVAERHLYLALPGFCLFIGCLFSKIPPRWSRISLGILLLGFCFASFDRAQDWRTSVTIWRSAYRQYPNKLRVLLNYANALEFEFDDASSVFHLYSDWLANNVLERGTFEDQDVFLQRMLLAGMRSIGTDMAVWREELAERLPSKKDRFWRDYLLREMLLRSEQRNKFLASWSLAYRDLRSLPPSEHGKDSEFWKSRMNIQLARFLAAQGRHERAVLLYEEVFSRFPESEVLPYWNELLPYSQSLRALGAEEKELKALNLLATYQQVFKIYAPPVLMRLGELYEKKGEWLQAADAYGGLVRTKVDDPDLRERYGRMLAHFAPRRAGVQKEQARYFSLQRIKPFDIREAVTR